MGLSEPLLGPEVRRDGAREAHPAIYTAFPGARLLSTQGLGHKRVLDDAGVIAAALAFLRGEPVGARVVSSPNLPFGIA